MNYSLCLINAASAGESTDVNRAHKFLLQQIKFDPPASEIRKIFNLFKTTKTSQTIDKTQSRKN